MVNLNRIKRRLTVISKEKPSSWENSRDIENFFQHDEIKNPGNYSLNKISFRIREFTKNNQDFLFENKSNEEIKNLIKDTIFFNTKDIESLIDKFRIDKTLAEHKSKDSIDNLEEWLSRSNFNDYEKQTETSSIKEDFLKEYTFISDLYTDNVNVKTLLALLYFTHETQREMYNKYKNNDIDFLIENTILSNKELLINLSKGEEGIINKVQHYDTKLKILNNIKHWLRLHFKIFEDIDENVDAKESIVDIKNLDNSFEKSIEENSLEYIYNDLKDLSFRDTQISPTVEDTTENIRKSDNIISLGEYFNLKDALSEGLDVSVDKEDIVSFISKRDKKTKYYKLINEDDYKKASNYREININKTKDTEKLKEEFLRNVGVSKIPMGVSGKNPLKTEIDSKKEDDSLIKNQSYIISSIINSFLAIDTYFKKLPKNNIIEDNNTKKILEELYNISNNINSLDMDFYLNSESPQDILKVYYKRLTLVKFFSKYEVEDKKDFEDISEEIDNINSFFDNYIYNFLKDNNSYKIIMDKINTDVNSIRRSILPENSISLKKADFYDYLKRLNFIKSEIYKDIEFIYNPSIKDVDFYDILKSINNKFKDLNIYSKNHFDELLTDMKSETVLISSTHEFKKLYKLKLYFVVFFKWVLEKLEDSEASNVKDSLYYLEHKFFRYFESLEIRNEDNSIDRNYKIFRDNYINKINNSISLKETEDIRNIFIIIYDKKEKPKSFKDSLEANDRFGENVSPLKKSIINLLNELFLDSKNEILITKFEHIVTATGIDIIELKKLLMDEVNVSIIEGLKIAKSPSAINTYIELIIINIEEKKKNLETEEYIKEPQKSSLRKSVTENIKVTIPSEVLDTSVKVKTKPKTSIENLIKVQKSTIPFHKTIQKEKEGLSNIPFAHKKPYAQTPSSIKPINFNSVKKSWRLGNYHDDGTYLHDKAQPYKGDEKYNGLITRILKPEKNGYLSIKDRENSIFKYAIINNMQEEYKGSFVLKSIIPQADDYQNDILSLMKTSLYERELKTHKYSRSLSKTDELIIPPKHYIKFYILLGEFNDIIENNAFNIFYVVPVDDGVPCQIETRILNYVPEDNLPDYEKEDSKEAKKQKAYYLADRTLGFDGKDIDASSYHTDMSKSAFESELDKTREKNDIVKNLKDFLEDNLITDNNRKEKFVSLEIETNNVEERLSALTDFLSINMVDDDFNDISKLNIMASNIDKLNSRLENLKTDKNRKLKIKISKEKEDDEFLDLYKSQQFKTVEDVKDEDIATDEDYEEKEDDIDVDYEEDENEDNKKDNIDIDVDYEEDEDENEDNTDVDYEEDEDENEDNTDVDYEEDENEDDYN